jgi:hypothetical protein
LFYPSTEKALLTKVAGNLHCFLMMTDAHCTNCVPLHRSKTINTDKRKNKLVKPEKNRSIR